MREFQHPKERPHGGLGGSRRREGAVLQNSRFFLASCIPCPIPLGVDTVGFSMGKK